MGEVDDSIASISQSTRFLFLPPPSPLANPAVWMRAIANSMVRNSVSFSQAANEFKLPLSPTECEKVVKRKEFQQILRQEKNSYRQEVANEPGRTKSTAVGMMVLAIENLILKGEDDKAVAAIEKLAKLEGWLGADSNINVFAGLTSKDIAEQKQKLKDEIALRSAGEPETIRPN